MTKEHLITAPEKTTLEEASEILRSHKIEKLILINEEGKLTGLITIKDIEKLAKYPNSAKDAKRTSFSCSVCRDYKRYG